MAGYQYGCNIIRLVFFSFVQSHIQEGYPAFFDRTHEKSQSSAPKYNFGWTTLFVRLCASGIFAKPAEKGSIVEHTSQACLLEFMKYGQIYASGNL